MLKYQVKINKNTYCETGSLGPFSNGICTDLYWIALYDFQNKYSLQYTMIYWILIILDKNVRKVN